jgi:Cu/Ag efflux protein CusF
MKRLFAFAAALVVAAAAQAQAPSVAGEVVKIDKPAGRLTLRHGEIKHLDVPAMTLTYKVRDPKQLDELAPGDRVRFMAERVDGQYTVTMVLKAPS